MNPPIENAPHMPTLEALDLLAWWSQADASAFTRTLESIHALPEIRTCPACDGLGLESSACPVRGPWSECRRCDGWGHV